jgi:hypothetical protein
MQHFQVYCQLRELIRTHILLEREPPIERLEPPTEPWDFLKAQEEQAQLLTQLDDPELPMEYPMGGEGSS